MSRSRRVAFLGNSLPRRRGNTAFINDLQQAIAATGLTADTAIVAMTDEGRHYDYPAAVRWQVQDREIEEYERAAQFLNDGGFEVVSLQHEFEIFGGKAGGHVMILLAKLAMPIVTTLHTVLAQPSPAQQRVLREIADISASVVVMTRKGRGLLQAEYGVQPHKIVIIPQGPRIAERYLARFERAISLHSKLPTRETEEKEAAAGSRLPPPMRLHHFIAMCDDTGLFRQATRSVPDRSQGYCVDDNARALLLSCALNSPGEERLPEAMMATFTAFVQHAWNPATERFRDFLSFERHWMEGIGSEDTHGRVLWALGECARTDLNLPRGHWAAALFDAAAPIVASFQEPRAWAFTLLGLKAFRDSFPHDARAAQLQRLLADRLLSLLEAGETPSWAWLQDGHSCDTARLPQALIATGVAVGNPAYLAAGLKSLRWMVALQTAENGFFRPVGQQGFGDVHREPREFDQQPLEATATVSACLTAWHADAEVLWRAHAVRAFEWFLGNNDLSMPLVNEGAGSCCDGLHPGRASENEGGAAVVSYLLALAEIRGLVRFTILHAKPAFLQALRALAH